MTNSEAKLKAKQDLKGNYGYAILTIGLLSAVAVGSIISVVGAIIVAGAVVVSLEGYWISVALRQKWSVDNTFRGFRGFLTALIVFLLVALITWGAVIVGLIPGGIVAGIGGIIAANVENAATVGVIISVFGMILLYAGVIICVAFVEVRLSFVFDVAFAFPQLSAFDCIKKSWALTKGKFWKLIGFYLSFIGWYILCVITAGILFYYVAPYVCTARANLFLSFLDDEERVQVTRFALDEEAEMPEEAEAVEAVEAAE